MQPNFPSSLTPRPFDSTEDKKRAKKKQESIGASDILKQLQALDREVSRALKQSTGSTDYKKYMEETLPVHLIAINEIQKEILAGKPAGVEDNEIEKLKASCDAIKKKVDDCSYSSIVLQVNDEKFKVNNKFVHSSTLLESLLGERGGVEVPLDCSKRSLEQLLALVAEPSSVIITKDNVQEIYHLAEELDIPVVLTLCQKVLEESLNLSDFTKDFCDKINPKVFLENASTSFMSKLVFHRLIKVEDPVVFMNFEWISGVAKSKLALDMSLLSAEEHKALLTKYPTLDSLTKELANLKLPLFPSSLTELAYTRKADISDPIKGKKRKNDEEEDLTKKQKISDLSRVLENLGALGEKINQASIYLPTSEKYKTFIKDTLPKCEEAIDEAELLIAKGMSLKITDDKMAELRNSYEAFKRIVRESSPIVLKAQDGELYLPRKYISSSATLKDLLEEFPDEGEFEVPLECSKSTLEEVLDLMVDPKSVLITKENASQIYALANYLDMPDILKLCNPALEQDLKLSDFTEKFVSKDTSQVLLKNGSPTFVTKLVSQYLINLDNVEIKNTFQRIAPFIKDNLALDVSLLSEDERKEFLTKYPSLDALIDILIKLKLTHITHFGVVPQWEGERGWIVGGLDKVFKSFNNLRTLSYKKANYLARECLQSISECKQLTTLDFSDCRYIATEECEYISKCKQLTTLNLSGGCAITDKDLEHISKCKQLTTLNLSGSTINNKELEHISKCTQLTTLNLSGSTISGEGLEHISKCTQLTTLNLSGCFITDKDLEHISKCTQLTTLNLSGSTIIGGEFKHISKCKQLTTLDLSGCAITDEGLKHISKCKQLTTLDLSGCAITDEGLKHISKCKRLTTLIIESNEWITGEALYGLWASTALNKLIVTNYKNEFEIHNDPRLKNVKFVTMPKP